MRAPKLTRKLTLDGPAPTADGAGGMDVVWVELGVVWAEIVPRTGREVESGDRTTPIQKHKVTVRAAPMNAPSRPRADQRFREGARIYNILSVSELDATGRFLVCDVEERPVA